MTRRSTSSEIRSVKRCALDTAAQGEFRLVLAVHDRCGEGREYLGDEKVLLKLCRGHARAVFGEEGVNQLRLRLRQPLHVYSMTRGPNAILRFTRAPGTAMRSPAGTCVVRLSM